MVQNSKTSSTQQFLLYIVIFNLMFSIFSFIWHMDEKGKTVYVDSIRLMNQYKGMEDARAELKSKSTIWQSNLDTLNKELQQAIIEFEKSKTKASVREKELMESIIKSKQQQYSSYEDNIRQQFQTQDQELTKKVLDKINDYIKRYGKKRNYDFILAATQYGNIVFANDGHDITDEILTGLNAEYEGK